MITGWILSGVERHPLFAEGLPGMEVTGCTVNTAMDEVDSAELLLPASNKAARSLLSKNSVVEIRDDGKPVFIGDIATVTQSEDGTRRLQLDGALGWLRCITKPPFGIAPTNQNSPVARFLAAIFDQYNAGLGGGARLLQLGVVTVTGYVTMDHNEEYTRMLDLFQEVRKQLGGHYYVTYSDGNPLLHYVDAPSTAGLQTLEFGTNVLKVENQLDFTDYASRVYATGKDESDQLIMQIAKDSTAEEIYGRVDYPLKTDGKTAAEILTMAQAVLAARKNPLRSLTMTAVDLADLGLNYHAFSIGTVARALCTPLGIDTDMMVQSVKRDYIHYENSVVTLGMAPRTLTSTIASASGSPVSGSPASGQVDADYVVEQGVSGRWSYRKWNSGIGECWGQFSTNVITVNSAWGQVYYGTWMDTMVNKTARQYPFAFTEDPIVETSLYTNEGDGWLAPDTNNNYGTLRTYAPAYCLVRPTVGTFTLPRISYHVTGRWK